MVRRAPTSRSVLMRTAVLLCAVLALGSCKLIEFAFASTFPAAATQVTARRDLSSQVSAADAPSFSLSDVTAGGREYVILSSGIQSGGTRLIIMDTGLNVILSLTGQYLAGLGGSLGSAPAKLDAMGRVLIGNVFFQTIASGLVFPPLVFPVPTGPGFASPVGGNFNFTNFGASGNNFSYSQYYDTWLPKLPTNSWTFPIRASPVASTSFFVHGVFSDPARQVALFVLYDSGDSQDHYFVIPLGQLDGGGLSPLLQDYKVFTKPATREDLLGYSNGGLIRFVPGDGNSGSGAFVRSDLSGADQSNHLQYFNLPAMRQAFSPSGGTYFSFDLGTRILTRLTAWWN